VEYELKKMLGAKKDDSFNSATMILVYLNGGVNAKDIHRTRDALSRIEVDYHTGKESSSRALKMFKHPMVENLLSDGGGILLTSPTMRLQEITAEMAKFKKYHLMAALVRNKLHPKHFMVLSPSKTEKAIALPPQKELFAQAIGQLMQGPQALVYALSSTSMTLVNVLQYYLHLQKTKDNKPAEAAATK